MKMCQKSLGPPVLTNFINGATNVLTLPCSALVPSLEHCLVTPFHGRTDSANALMQGCRSLISCTRPKVGGLRGVRSEQCMSYSCCDSDVTDVDVNFTVDPITVTTSVTTCCTVVIATLSPSATDGHHHRSPSPSPSPSPSLALTNGVACEVISLPWAQGRRLGDTSDTSDLSDTSDISAYISIYLTI